MQNKICKKFCQTTQVLVFFTVCVKYADGLAPRGGAGQKWGGRLRLYSQVQPVTHSLSPLTARPLSSILSDVVAMATPCWSWLAAGRERLFCGFPPAEGQAAARREGQSFNKCRGLLLLLFLHIFLFLVLLFLLCAFTGFDPTNQQPIFFAIVAQKWRWPAGRQQRVGYSTYHTHT